MIENGPMWRQAKNNVAGAARNTPHHSVQYNIRMLRDKECITVGLMALSEYLYPLVPEGSRFMPRSEHRVNEQDHECLEIGTFEVSLQSVL